MKLIRYGIIFRRVQKEDIEKLRQWRNSEDIRNKMIYKKYITPEMQKEWFRTIEKSYHHSYYIINVKNKDIGLFNQKNFNIQGKITESGLFIVDPEYKTSYIPVIASLTMIQSSFFAMGETESFVRTIKTNHEALNYNYSLGYEIFKEEKDFYILRMTPESFLRKTKKLRKAIRNLYGKSYLEIILEPIDFQLDYGYYFKNLMQKIPKHFVVKLTKTDNTFRLVADVDLAIC